MSIEAKYLKIRDALTGLAAAEIFELCAMFIGIATYRSIDKQDAYDNLGSLLSLTQELRGDLRKHVKRI